MALGQKRLISHLTFSPIVTTTTPPIIDSPVPTSDEDTSNSKISPTLTTSNYENFIRCFSNFI